MQKVSRYSGWRRVWLTLSAVCLTVTSVVSFYSKNAMIVSAEEKADFAAALTNWCGSELSDDLVSDWSLVITLLREDFKKLDGVSSDKIDNMIAGMMGNQAKECGGFPWAVEGYYGNAKASDGTPFSQMQTGKSYTFDNEPGHWGTGHGIIQFSFLWAERLVEWSKKSKYPTVKLTHKGDVNYEYGTSDNPHVAQHGTHNCELCSAIGQTEFLLRCLNNVCDCNIGHGFSGLLEEYAQNASSPESAAKWFAGHVEKPAESEYDSRMSYAKEAAKAVKILTGPIGSMPNGELSDQQQTEVGMLTGNLVSLGLWEEEQFIDISKFVESSLILPSDDDLNLIDRENLHNWSQTVKFSNEDKKLRVPRQIFLLIGILITVYSIFLYIAYWFDKTNNFVDISTLRILSFGRYAVSPDDIERSQGKKSAVSTKVITSRGMLMVCGIGVAIGIFLLSGKAFLVIATVIGWLSSQVIK